MALRPRLRTRARRESRERAWRASQAASPTVVAPSGGSPIQASWLRGAEAGRPVRRALQVRTRSPASVQAPRAVVTLVAGEPPRRLDLRPFVPLVERRDRHAVRACPNRRRPHRVVRCAAAARLDVHVARGTAVAEAGPDGRQAEQLLDMRLRAQPRELVRAGDADVVAVNAGEAALL